jgi:hypothetical protein
MKPCQWQEHLHSGAVSWGKRFDPGKNDSGDRPGQKHWQWDVFSEARSLSLPLLDFSLPET